jgi:iron complex transport system substrate-binding protein
MASLRVVSLIASATEIIAALGARDLLVARSHECDFPADVAALPAVTAPKLDIARPSGDIDRQVKALLEQALSVYRVDAAQLRDLRPDVIVTQTQCEVCAVSQSDVEAALAEWTGARPRIVSLAPNALADVFADIQSVADALGVPERGRNLVSHLRARMDDIAATAAPLRTRPRVAAIEWIEPLMAAGNWVPEMIAMAGGENLFGAAGKHSPWMEWRDLVAADPDIVVVLPCGFDIDRGTREMAALTARPEWHGLGAVRDDRVFVVDGNQYFNRPGPRLADSLEILAELLHPETFRARHTGSGWIRLPQTVS